MRYLSTYVLRQIAGLLMSWFGGHRVSSAQLPFGSTPIAEQLIEKLVQSSVPRKPPTLTVRELSLRTLNSIEPVDGAQDTARLFSSPLT